MSDELRLTESEARCLLDALCQAAKEGFMSPTPLDGLDMAAGYDEYMVEKLIRLSNIPTENLEGFREFWKQYA